MRFFLILFFLIPLLGRGNTFRIPYQNEITEINPLNLRSASGSYIHHALFRNLFWIDEKNKLKNDLADLCIWKTSKKLICKLRKTLKWSNGENLKAQDFIQTYEFILNPNSNFSRKELLFTIVNARAYANGEIADFTKVGVRLVDDFTLEYTLVKKDPEFEYKLALPMIAPVKQRNFNLTTQLISSGPYRIKNIDTKSLEITMENNPFFHINSSRPVLKFVYIADDSVQIPLYVKNQIDFVRRIPTAQIPQWQKEKSFQSIQVLRFDYFGFNLSKINKPLRQAMSEVIDYFEMQNLFHSTGRPGCFEFSDQAIDKPICFVIRKNIQKNILKDPIVNRKASLELVFSHLGSEDHQRAGEWLKSEWKKSLGLDVMVKQLENKVFISTLKNNLPPLFRKGVPLETPLCYSAVKIFEPDNPENLNKLSDPFLTNQIAKLKKETKIKKQKIICHTILNYIKDNAFIIPTGRYELSILMRENFKNLKINQLNMIDFSQY